jgi:hypothetical protein
MPQSHDSVEAFRDIAASYCALVERVEDFERDEIFRRLGSLLPQMIYAATQLPELEPASEVEAPEISRAAWSERFGALNSTLGELGDYWTTMAVAGPDEPEVVYLPLADDLADIWRDLSGGLSLLASGGNVADAVWEWRFLFQVHWGAHAVEALRAVHAARRG